MKIKQVSQWLDVPSTDPDDARRRKLLNILLVGTGAVALLTLLATTVVVVTGMAIQHEGVTLVYFAGLATVFGIVVIFAMNRYWSGGCGSLRQCVKQQE